MKRSHIFLFISIIGICYTWFYNIQYFMSYEDASLVHFFELAQSNFAGKSFGADLSVVVLTFFVWFIPDARKLKIKLLCKERSKIIDLFFFAYLCKKESDDKRC